jgi:hypothetical protein
VCSLRRTPSLLGASQGLSVQGLVSAWRPSRRSRRALLIIHRSARGNSLTLLCHTHIILLHDHSCSSNSSACQCPISTPQTKASPPVLGSCRRANMTTNTAANTCDDLDEFFDFSLLEHDHGLENRPYQGQDEPQVLAEDVLMMDWQPPSAESSRSSTSTMTSYQQTQIQTALDGHIPNEWQFGALPHEMPVVRGEYANTQAINPQHACTTVSGAQSQESLHCSPPSSLPARELPGSIGDVMANPVDVHQTSVLPQLEQRNDEHVTRSPLPTRQASTSSWKPASAKCKGPQNRIPLESRQILEDEFATNPYPCSWEMDIIAHQASLDVKRVRNWFNNTRARKKCEGTCSVAFSMLF